MGGGLGFGNECKGWGWAELRLGLNRKSQMVVAPPLWTQLVSDG